MTVYNYIEKEDKWHRTVVDNVQWRHVREQVIVGTRGVAVKENHELVTINDFFEYVEPARYMGEGWTLNPDTTQDVIVLGRCEDNPEDADFDITKVLKANSGNSGIVRSVVDARNKPYLPIIKVVAK